MCTSKKNDMLKTSSVLINDAIGQNGIEWNHCVAINSRVLIKHFSVPFKGCPPCHIVHNTADKGAEDYTTVTSYMISRISLLISIVILTKVQIENWLSKIFVCFVSKKIRKLSSTYLQDDSLYKMLYKLVEMTHRHSSNQSRKQNWKPSPQKTTWSTFCVIWYLIF